MDNTDSLSWDPPHGLDTPIVVVDSGALDRNIELWATRMTERSIGLRPHTKTTKCTQIIERQISAGVVGLTVATLGEAEVLADAGFDDLFQAYPMWAGHPQRAERLRDLHERVRLTIGVESPASARALGAAVEGAGSPLDVLIELDPGLHRTGVDAADIVTVAQAAESAGLRVRGAFTFGGHAYADCDAAPGAASDEVRTLTVAAELLTHAGFEASILSAGSTPTALHSASAPVTDERPGTYVFQDAQQLALGVASVAEIALVVMATVISSTNDGRFVLDSGSKSLSSDRPSWLPGHGLLPSYPDAELRSLSEHHCVCHTSGPRPAIGETVAVVPNHCCVVVNLVDELTIVENGEVVDQWPVASRGMNN